MPNETHNVAQIATMGTLSLTNRDLTRPTGYPDRVTWAAKSTPPSAKYLYADRPTIGKQIMNPMPQSAVLKYEISPESCGL